MKVDIESPMVTETKLGSGTTKSSTPLDYERNTQVNESVLHFDHDFVPFAGQIQYEQPNSSLCSFRITNANVCQWFCKSKNLEEARSFRKYKNPTISELDSLIIDFGVDRVRQNRNRFEGAEENGDVSQSMPGAVLNSL
ncbi:hypothetical protein L2E82_52302 [Cichorium intybus]|nr:hypothetical protein L2E82_52302 [Cichorium intybus]